MSLRYFNPRGAWAIFINELMRAFRTWVGSIFSPVLTTSLYFIVFGAAIGSRISEVNGVSYGAFIVPGLLMLTLLSESTQNASFGIYMPRFTGAIYELLSAPVGFVETLLGFVGAAAMKSLILAAIILFTAKLFVDYQIVHPLLAVGYIVLISAAFSLFGFIIGIWADGWERLGMIPLLFLTPLTFLDARRAVANDRAIQPDRLSRERVALDLHREVRRRDLGFFGDDVRFPRAVRRGDRGNFPHRLALAELTR